MVSTKPRSSSSSSMSTKQGQGGSMTSPTRHDRLSPVSASVSASASVSVSSDARPHSLEQINETLSPTSIANGNGKGDSHEDYFGYGGTSDISMNRTTSSIGLMHHPRRGMTFEQVHKGGIISSRERSLEFDGIPLSDDEIKKLPKKVRPYYRKLALLQAHYLEVDALLSGSLPQKIALSFHSPGQNGHLGGNTNNESEISSPGWGRRSSAWQVKNSRVSAEHEGEEVGEGTALLSKESKEERRERIAKIALNVNTIVNVLLVGAKAIAVLYSSSISLTASLVDSALDLLSTFIILGTSWAIGVQSNKHLYPAGKRRFEPLGVLIFSVAMIASFVQVFIESFQRAIGPPDDRPVALSKIGMGTMLATIGVKAVLWVWCSRIPSSGVQALAQDAENDVFFNIMSLAFPSLGSALKFGLLDPIGGMVLSTYIIYEWVKTLFGNFANLSGRSASQDQVARVIYLVSRFNPVLEISDLECYHIGDDLIVEVDVILPRSSTLHFAHDVGETIQCVLESLDGVLRAYVHCDYSSANPAQHTTRNPLPLPVTYPETTSLSSSSGSATPRPNGSMMLANSRNRSGEMPIASPSEMDEE